MSFYNKYLKYKNKYLELKKQYGGDFNQYGGNFKCPVCMYIGNDDYQCKNCTQDASMQGRNANVLDLLGLPGIVNSLNRDGARALLATGAVDDRLTQQIQAHKWLIDEKLIHIVFPQNIFPRAIAVKHNTKGFVLVNDTGNIINYDFNGKPINSDPNPELVCGGVAISPDDNYMVLSDQMKHTIYVLNIETKEVVDNFGSVGEVNDQFTAPTSVAISNAEGGGYYVLVADSGNYRIVILKMTNEGKLSWDSTINKDTVNENTVILDNNIQSKSICVTPNGICFFVDMDNKCIVKFNIGKYNFVIYKYFDSLPGFNPKYVAVSDDGRYLCVACTIKDYKSQCIVLFDIHDDILTFNKLLTGDQHKFQSKPGLGIILLAMSPNADAVFVIDMVKDNTTLRIFK